MVFRSLLHLHICISIFQNYIFLTDQESKRLYAYDRETSKMAVNFELTPAVPYDIIMYDQEQQPIEKCKLVSFLSKPLFIVSKTIIRQCPHVAQMSMIVRHISRSRCSNIIY